MELPIYYYVLAAIGGVAAGAINTLSGSGSAVTLTILAWLGLPAPLANGTNRVGIVVQTAVSTWTLRRGGKLQMERRPGGWWLVAAAVIGAMGGSLVAAELDEAALDLAIGVVMVGLLVAVMVKPKKWLRTESEVEPGRPRWTLLLGFVLIGAYGGFVQAGVGILILAGLVLGAGYALIEANALKNLMAFCFTVPALVIFALHDQVDWAIGALMASGQALGAWAAARFALENERAHLWVRRLLVVVLIFGIVRFFHIWDWATAALAQP